MRMPEWALEMCKTLEDAGNPIYFVGGSVRNSLMGLPLSDIDICGPARLPNIAHAIEEASEKNLFRIKYIPRAPDFGTAEIQVVTPEGDKHSAEYTVFRQDSYRGGHRPHSVAFTTSLPADALRRDFSSNAIYYRAKTNEIIDPTGGIADIKAKTLKTVTPHPDMVLKDDGLRILRAIRFSCELGLAPDGALKSSLLMHQKLLRDIAAERIAAELNKILTADLRYPGTGFSHAHALSALSEISALDINFNNVAPVAARGEHGDILCARWASVLVKNDVSIMYSLKLPHALIKRAELIANAAQAFMRGGECDTLDTLLPLAKTAGDAGLAADVVSGYGCAGAAHRILRESEKFNMHGVPPSPRGLPIKFGAFIEHLNGKPRRLLSELAEELWRMVVLHPELNNTEDLLRAGKQWLSSAPRQRTT